MRYFLLLLSIILCFTCSPKEPTIEAAPTVKTTVEEKSPLQPPIPFAPENYICYRNSAPLIIDGKADENDWQKSPWTKSFVDIEGDLKPKPAHDTKVKMLWDKDYFYFYAKMVEPHIWAKLKQRDTIIFFDDDFEIFIDPDGDSHNYYELEVNAFNTLWELILLRPYRADGKHKVLNNWNIPNIKSAIHIEGTLNNAKDEDQYWAVEMAIPWSALIEFASPPKLPKDGDQWRVNFSRVDWTMDTKNGNYQKAIDPKTSKPFPADNWVWSPTGFINMHMPEQWGFVQFSEKIAGKGTSDFIEHQDEEIKMALWDLYFQQIKSFEKNNMYTDDINLFTIPVLENSDCDFQPKIYATPHLFEIVVKSCERDGNWSIRQDGKIDFIKIM
ncbi:MAG: carbohydrate-binding family 9-like protein [Saprospiraceae bacterium]